MLSEKAGEGEKGENDISLEEKDLLQRLNKKFKRNSVDQSKD